MNGILNFLLIFSIFVFIFYILFLARFKVDNPTKSVRVSFLVSIVAMAFLSLILYKSGIDYSNIGQKNDFVRGQIVSIGENEIRINILNNNMNLSSKEKLNVEVSNTTIIRAQQGVFEKNINFYDLKIGNVVNVICDENSLENSLVTAQKIVSK
jgi:hypothetical protein